MDDISRTPLATALLALQRILAESSLSAAEQLVGAAIWLRLASNRGPGDARLLALEAGLPVAEVESAISRLWFTGHLSPVREPEQVATPPPSPMARFLAECTVSSSVRGVAAATLRAVYGEFVRRSGAPALSMRELGLALGDAGLQKMRSNGIHYRLELSSAGRKLASAAGISHKARALSNGRNGPRSLARREAE